MSKTEWVPTSQASKALGVTNWTLYNILRPKLKNTRKRKYWKVTNPAAKRKTYRWNVKAIEEWQEEGSNY